MKREELRNTLIGHLDTLKRNRAAVPLEVLKTKYRKPYTKLCQDIADTASAYVRTVTLGDIRLLSRFLDEAVPIIQTAIDESGILRQISKAAFRRQSIEEINQLAETLKKQIDGALEPFYERHLCLYASEECFGDPPRSPELYNEATGCVFRNGKWIPLEIKKEAAVFHVIAKREETQECGSGRENKMAG